MLPKREQGNRPHTQGAVLKSPGASRRSPLVTVRTGAGNKLVARGGVRIRTDCVCKGRCQSSLTGNLERSEGQSS